MTNLINGHNSLNTFYILWVEHDEILFHTTWKEIETGMRKHVHVLIHRERFGSVMVIMIMMEEATYPCEMDYMRRKIENIYCGAFFLFVYNSKYIVKTI